MALNSPRVGADGSECPPAERLAEYAEQLLSDSLRSQVDCHLVACRDCRDALHTAVSFATHDGEADASSAERRNVLWFRRRPAAVAAILTATAALLLVVRIAPWSGRNGVQPAAFQRLVAAVAAEPARPLEGRIAGLPYVPPRSVTRGTAPVDVTAGLRIAAADVESKLATGTRPEDARTVGLAYLLVGDLDRAIPRLADAAKRVPANAIFASDLSAAYLARGERDRDPADVRLAIESADRALQLDPDLMEARFNRALALAALPQPDLRGLRDYAQREQGPWADEARRRAASRGSRND